ncbi:hypothetical protein [Glacieibacterium frigidum]|uniref:DoxX family protein n=1 Tax=Glacieibacterium frigidum TaxID=2593303 RepID=A0A552UH29_9SPHN|nr:hypothetical protein [Glacieibacterium frigidum]TRW17533.1 hypothetical protein FMM06_05105 [Glacieibacterium frigidum]
MATIRRYQFVFILYIAFVFIQSLFFKFTNSPETQYIFGTLDVWAAGLGFGGVFAPGGIFSQYVIGSFELIASVALLLSLFPALRLIRPYAALLALGVISGAIFFHLFTPLGVAVQNTDGTSDGGELFALACGVWVSAAFLVALNRDRLPIVGRRAAAA